MAGTFASPLCELKEYLDIEQGVQKRCGPIQINGLVETQKIELVSRLRMGYGQCLIVTSQETAAREIFEDYYYFDRRVSLYPAKDLLFYHADIRGNQITRERLKALKCLLEETDWTIVTTIDGCMDYIMSRETLINSLVTFEEGAVVDLEAVSILLSRIGYEREQVVEEPGQFTIRGGILDVFPLTDENPVRIELWGDEIDSIRSFDVESQRSIEQLTTVTIYPAKEIYEDKEMSSVLLPDWLSERSIIFLDEPGHLYEKAEATEKVINESLVGRIEKGYNQTPSVNPIASAGAVFDLLMRPETVGLCGFDQKVPGLAFSGKYQLLTKSGPSYQNGFEWLIKDLKAWQKDGTRVVLLSGSRTRAERLAKDLRDEYELKAFFRDGKDEPVEKGTILVLHGTLHKGFEYPTARFVVIPERDMFNRVKTKKHRKNNYAGKKVSSFQELTVGDYVVHENHGLGIYRGIEKLEVDNITKDYIKVEYSGKSNLYIPVTGLSAIQKYADSETTAPKLNRLGGSEWSRTKKRVRGAVKEIARELVELYAKRQRQKGFEYGTDTVWQKEFEELFPYEETEDQGLAIEETKRDMESPRIMDRLICGDVGYGKTEIALRAAFKAVQENKQVAYLVPTTILAQQHYRTFSQRMMDFPVRVDLLSRFRTDKEQKTTLSDLKRGMVDIVIGTHRLLSSDVAFKDLGLLIIDEEQRFGVGHKEKIKQLRENVDVLTLTATPIPRTLHMSLIGIRDMSLLEQAPRDRTPIQTYVMEYHDEMVREAIERELDRGGQIYYVFNRVRNIEEITEKIRGLVPRANVTFAHGQMNERQLEGIMFDFINGEIDVLVSTTIIETGLDISNVNTIIIHDADRFGLAQLHQLRGRVGRSNRTAYAFLMYKRDRMLKEVAEKRLQAIREFTGLGSGLKIAMRDLEIRGAGNMLGAEQHGHMEAVGYDLYCKLLNEAVRALKGEDTISDFETSIDLPVDAYIPSSYIINEMQKLKIYKDISSIQSEEEYIDMQDELMDRFGKLPLCVQNLLRVAFIKARAHNLGICEVSGNKQELRLTLVPDAPIQVAALPVFIEKYKGSLKFNATPPPIFTLASRGGKVLETRELLDLLESFLEDAKESLSL